jgi:hypothetical protein
MVGEEETYLYYRPVYQGTRSDSMDELRVRDIVRLTMRSPVE